MYDGIGCGRNYHAYVSWRGQKCFCEAERSGSYPSTASAIPCFGYLKTDGPCPGRAYSEIVIDRLGVPEGSRQHHRRFIDCRVAERGRISEPLDRGRVETVGVLAMFLIAIERTMVLRYPELQPPSCSSLYTS